MEIADIPDLPIPVQHLIQAPASSEIENVRQILRL